MKKTPIIFIFILLLLVSLVSAVPPVSVIFTGESGLRIQAAPPRYLQANSIGETTIHVFNATNGVLMTNNTPGYVECKSLIQYPNGTILAQVNATPQYDHFKFSLNLSNIFELGEYGWVIHCNNSNQGGFLAGYFELTLSGNEDTPKDNSAGIAIVIFILSITGALFLFSMKKDILKNPYANIIARRSFLVLGIYLMILNSAIMATLAAASNLPIVQEMFTYMNLFGFVGYPAMVFLMLSALFQALHDMKIDKKKKRTGDEDD